MHIFLGIIMAIIGMIIGFGLIKSIGERKEMRRQQEKVDVIKNWMRTRG